jgi:hypothetical protein
LGVGRKDRGNAREGDVGRVEDVTDVVERSDGGAEPSLPADELTSEVAESSQRGDEEETPGTTL